MSRPIAAAAADPTLHPRSPISMGSWFAFPRDGNDPQFLYYIIEPIHCDKPREIEVRQSMLKKIFGYALTYKHWRVLHLTSINDLPPRLERLIRTEYYADKEFVPYKIFGLVQVPFYYGEEWEQYTRLYTNDVTHLAFKHLTRLNDDPELFSFFKINYDHYYSQF